MIIARKIYGKIDLIKVKTVYIGLDIGGTKCSAVLGEEKDGIMHVLDKVKFNTPKGKPSKVLAVFDDFISEKSKKYKINGIGISCGGPLDSKQGVIISPPNLPGWRDIQAVAHFEDKFKIKTFLQNDANACAIAEWKYGAGKGLQNIVFLTFGTGLGAGLILNGRLYSGTNGMAGEVGHISLANRGPVGYGKIGSFEGFCSGNGLAQLGIMAVKKELKKGNAPRLWIEANNDFDRITAKLIGDLAEDGDELCRGIYAYCGKKLGEGLSIIIDILNPEMIILGSIYTRSEHLLKEHAQRVIERRALKHSAEVCKLSKAVLSDAIGDIAALSVATGRF